MWDFPTRDIIVHSINIHIFVRPRRKQLVLASLLKCSRTKKKKKKKKKRNATKSAKKRVHRQMMINCKTWH